MAYASGPGNERALVKELGRALSRDRVLSGAGMASVYECDAYTVERRSPLAVVLPESTEEVSRVVRLCVRHGIPFVARGAGTGLSGGALAPSGGVVISLKKMDQILEIDLENRCLRAQCGIANAKLTQAVAKDGFHFAPDPSSQQVSTLGGNIAENAGGPHTLKYGVTANHVLAATIVDPLGNIVKLGSRVAGGPGYDLLGLFAGSEGTMGIATEAWVRLTPNPAQLETATAFFGDPRQASQAVADMIAGGVVPLALEYLDSAFMKVLSEAFGLVFPERANAYLLMEFDGSPEDVERELEMARVVCQSNQALHWEVAQNDLDRQRQWFARKNAVGALGRHAPSKVTHDGVIPRSKLPDMLAYIRSVAERRQMLIATLCHAGDGNLHPNMPLDDRVPAEVASVREAGWEILRECVRLGGSITGEHGVGVEKREFMSLMYGETDLQIQADAAAILNRGSLCNPGKVLPEDERVAS